MLRPTRTSLALAAIGAALLAAGALIALRFSTRLSNVPPSAPDYAADSTWICRPGRADVCAPPTTATVFAPGGEKQIVTYKPASEAPIDCFYVYPTVSRVRAAYAPIALGPEESKVTRDQFARFASVCRPFAPLYRQVTLRGLPDLFGARNGVTIDVPYADVLAAWKAYLAKDNRERGVVLVGHSQGARLLARLIAQEIDGKPIASKLVSAILPGTMIDVPDEKSVGGTYKQTPLCASSTQTGCVIAYSSYPANTAIPADARFGASRNAGMRYACVNPAEVNGEKHLKADLPVPRELREKYATDFFEFPGLLTSACEDDGPFSVLAVDAHPHDMAGERATEKLHQFADRNPVDGLHALDIALALGTLVDIVRKQTDAYLHH